MLTFEQLINEHKPNHNDICILYDMTLVRLVGVAEDEDDYYYIVREVTPKGEYLASCVGWLYSLKGIIAQERYDNMDNLFSLNGAERSDEFIIQRLGEFS